MPKFTIRLEYNGQFFVVTTVLILLRPDLAKVTLTLIGLVSITIFLLTIAFDFLAILGKYNLKKKEDGTRRAFYLRRKTMRDSQLKCKRILFFYLLEILNA